ncbi:PRC-barrel domain-containing protein [Henriciella sp. AS95]|uniref:PRC-barrel domain-containing protein n=1 Tax=Henriciella sp. AS95 TaxID=3135782 RepID=UPI003178792C
MKNLMITAAASALIFGAAACSQSESTEYGETSYDETQTAEMTDETTMDDEVLMAETDTDMNADTMDADMVYLTSAELSAGELIGAEVIGSDGEKVAVVDDFLLAADGNVKSVIFKAGELNDFIGDKGAISYDRLDLTMDADNEPRFTVAMTDEAMEEITEFEQNGLNDYRLASEIIGTSADFINSDESIRINDIILTDAGKASYAIVGDLMGDERQIAYNKINIEQGDGGSIIIDASYDDLETMPIFKYEHDVEADTSNDLYDNDNELNADLGVDSEDEEMDTEQ